MDSKNTEELKDYEILVANNYILDARRNYGDSFGEGVYFGKEISTKNLVAIKLESLKKGLSSLLLRKEAEIYNILKGVERIPKIHWFGIQGNYCILIMDLLGNSLQAQMDFIKKPFSLGTTLKISIQLLKIIEKIHKKGVVLRYIKPENMAIGRGINEDYVYLIDFGLSKRYIKNGIHKPYKEGKLRKGNFNFISINTHLGIEISRRDDIESLGYNLVYFMKGKFPWSGLHSQEAKQKKIETNLDDLCKGLPEEFKEFINYARKLQFTEKPDYNYLNNLLQKAAIKNKININTVKYDWVIYKENLEKEKCSKKNNEKENKGKESNKEKIKDKESENKNSECDRKEVKEKISEINEIEDDKIIHQTEIRNNKIFEIGESEKDKKFVNKGNKKDIISENTEVEKDKINENTEPEQDKIDITEKEKVKMYEKDKGFENNEKCEAIK